MEPKQTARFVMDSAGRTLWTPNGTIPAQEPKAKAAPAKPVKPTSEPLNDTRMISFSVYLTSILQSAVT